MQHLLREIQTAYRTENVPEEWLKVVINLIYMKGEKTECGNHRGTTLLSHCGKLYSRLVERRLRRYIEPKLGFREGRGTLDLIFSMKMIMKKNWEWAK